MSKIIKLCNVPSDNLGASVSVPSTTRPITGEYSVSPYPGSTTVAGTPSGGMFYWGPNGSIADCNTLIDALATSLGTTVAGLIGKNVSSANMSAGKTIVAIGYTDRGNGLYTPVCWISGSITSSASGTATFGGGTTGGGSTITARVKGASTAKAVSAMKVWNDRSFRVTNADGTGQCKLVASAPGASEMNIVATDSTGNTYYVTRLFERLAIVTRKTGSSHQFATGSRVKWNESGAVLNVSVKV